MQGPDTESSLQSDHSEPGVCGGGGSLIEADVDVETLEMK